MRRFVVIGQRATASSAFSLVDIPGTSGRLDVLLRCLRAALLVSHGLRRDTVVYLVLLGGSEAPRTLRFDGSAAHYLRPDERHLAVTVQKMLEETRLASLAAKAAREAKEAQEGTIRRNPDPVAALLQGALEDTEARARARAGVTVAGFVDIRPGIAVAEGAIHSVLADIGGAELYVLEEGAADVRGSALGGENKAFFLGDHLGFDAASRAELAARGAIPVSVGPVSLQADDVIAIVANELDRRALPG